MAVDKLVDSTQLDTDLTSVANAIRAKSGGSSQLAFPAGFVSEIGNIPSGGGVTVDGLFDGSWPTGDITITVAVSRTNVLSDASGIRKVTMTYSGDGLSKNSVFINSGITEFVGLALTGIRGSTCFSGCASLAKVTIPKATYFEYNMCYNCGNLTIADIGGGAINRGGIFQNCKKLQTLIIRGTTACTLANVNNLSQTPFYPNGGTGITGTGTLYVPNALVNTYKTASNWSTLYNAGTMAIQKIEGSIYENAYADGTPIT